MDNETAGSRPKAPTGFVCRVCREPAPSPSPDTMPVHHAEPNAGLSGPCRGSLMPTRTAAEETAELCPECAQATAISVGGKFLKHADPAGEQSCPGSQQMAPGLLSSPAELAEAAEALRALPALDPTRHTNAAPSAIQHEPVPMNARAAGCLLLALSIPATGLIWLVGKPLLHGQIGWLWWTPIFALVAALAMDAFGQRRPRAAFATALAVLLLVAPALAKWQQTRAEDRFVRAVQELEREFGEPAGTRDAAVQLGWDFCYGLDEARGTPENTFPNNDPHGFVAELSLRTVGESTENDRLAEDFRTAVELADKYLC